MATIEEIKEETIKAIVDHWESKNIVYIGGTIPKYELYQLPTLDGMMSIGLVNRKTKEIFRILFTIHAEKEKSDAKNKKS